MKRGMSRLGLLLGAGLVLVLALHNDHRLIAWGTVAQIMVIGGVLGWLAGWIVGWALDGFRRKE